MTSQPPSPTFQPSPPPSLSSAKLKFRFQGLFKSKGRSSSGLISEGGGGRSSSFVSSESSIPPNNGENLEVHPKDKTGLFEWTPSCSNEDGMIDIIAVHGLNGDAHHTWQYGTKIWLRDFLPKQIPLLRIMSYGYNSAVLFSRSDANVEDFASELLSRLRGKRHTKAEKARPIVFICHSLGGIVVKQALISAHERPDIHSNILEHTKGIVFMGTPHVGTDAANWASIFVSLIEASTFGTVTNTPLLNGLKQNSELLTKICRQFTGRVSGLRVLTFYETLKCKGLNRLIVTRDSALLNHERERATAINADHTSICRFESIEGQDYEVVWSLIRDLIEDIRLPVVGPATVPFSEREQNLFAGLMASLFKVSTSTTAISNVSLRVEGTCTWILEHPKFLQWQAKNHSSNLLWITGGPGCGKTVLSSFLSEELKTSHPSTSVCSFFCYDKIDAKKVLCNTIHQLLSVKRELARHAFPHWEQKGEEFAQHWPTLCDIWKVCCNDPSSGGIILAIDALDECDKSSCADLLGFLMPLLQQLRMSSEQNKLKVLITSRPEVDLIQALMQVPVLNIMLENETQNLPPDIERVIHHGVQELIASGQIRSDKAATLKDKLRNKAGGTFLWVGMTLKLLRASMETKAMDSLVDNLPEELSDIYAQLLDRIPPNQRDRAKLTLQVIIAAQRPLTVSEVDLLLAIQPSHSSENEVGNLAEPQPYRMITTLCGSFIRIVNEAGTQYVYLVHQTAKEYLLRNQHLVPGGKSLLWHSFNNVEGNMALAERCIWFLLFRELDTKPLPQWSGNEQKDFESYVQDYAVNHALLSYTATYWATHFRESESVADLKILRQALSLYDIGSRYTTWSQVYWATLPSPPRNYPPLHMCSYNGHARLLEELLQESADSAKDVKDKDGETPLHKAAEAGHAKVIEVLLQNGADVTIRDKAWLTALHKAAKANREAAVQSLAKGGANIDARLKDGSTALHTAAADGLENMVRLLVDQGADVDILNGDGLTASDLAFNKGYGSIQRFLLEKQTDSGITLLDQAIIDGAEDKVNDIIDNGADFRQNDTRGLSPLHRAARVGNVSIVNILIGRGALKELTDNDGATVLHIASRHGNKEVVKALIGSNCNVNAQKVDGSRPLHEAVISGSESVVRLLLNAGAGIDNVDDDGKTALFYAANLGYFILLQVLLSSGCDYSIKAKKDRTPLHAAAEKGHGMIVQYLLEKGIFGVDCKDQEEETPLTLAARGASAAHADAVRLLLENGADAHTKQFRLCTPIFLSTECGNETSMRYLLKDSRVDPDGINNDRLTPLVIAAKNGHENAMLILFDHGAKSVDNAHSGRTPLSWAAEHGLERAVRRLLEFENVEIDASGDDGRTSLSWAAGKGHLTVVGCLLKDKRIDIDHADANLRTPLSWAAEGGHENVTRLLLDSGSNPALREKVYGRAAISWAALSGHDSIVQLLLERDPDALSSSVDRVGHSLLYLAAFRGHESMARFLLDHDEGYLNQMANSGKTPLFAASMEGHEDVVRLLLSRPAVNVNLQTRDGFSPLTIAAERGHQEIVEQLLKHDHIDVDAKNDDMNTPLGLAASKGHEAIVRILTERGADTSVLNIQKESPLHLAANGSHLAVVNLLFRNVDQILARNRMGQTPLWGAAATGSEEVVRALLSRLSAFPSLNHPDSTHRDDNLHTPLFAAVINGHAGTVRCLLKVPPFNEDSEDIVGQTPLSISVKAGHGDVVSTLLEYDPRVNLKDKISGRTPLLWACSIGRTDLIQLLLQRNDVEKDVRDKENASPIQLASASRSESAVRLLLDSGAGDLNLPEMKFGRSPLSTAASNGDIGITQLLLDQNAIEPNSRDKDGRTAFLLAVIAGHEPIVRLLSSSPKVDITLRDDFDQSPILAASSSGHTNILRLLIPKSHGQGDLNDRNISGASPLWCAAEQGQTATVHLLLLYGAKPNIRGGKDKRTPLIIAARYGFYEIVKMLLAQEEVEIEAKDLYGDSALTIAARKGHSDVVHLLLDKGAFPNARAGPSLRTPLMDAAQNGHENVVRVLLAHKEIEPDCENDAGRTPLYFACQGLADNVAERKYGYWQIFNMLLDHNVRPDSNDMLGYTPLMAAADCGNYEMARVLLEKGADPGLKEKTDGMTALSCAAGSGSETIIRMLLDRNDPRVNPDAATPNNETPLTLAVSNGHEGIVKLLLDLKPGVSLEHKTDADGRTPLMNAVEKGYTSIVRLLLQHKVDVNCYDAYGQTALIIATKSGYLSIIKELLQKDAKLNVKDKTGATPLIWAAINGHNLLLRLFLGKIEITARDRNGRTALSYAAGNGKQETVRILINEGELKSPDINTKDKQDYTPATWATMSGHTSTLQLLSESGADLDVRDRNGRSLLSHAAQNGHLQVLRFLLSQNQDVNLQDEAGRTAFSWAAESGHVALVRLLLEHGADMELKDKKMKNARSYAVDNDKKALVQLLDSQSASQSQLVGSVSSFGKHKRVAVKEGVSDDGDPFVMDLLGTC